MGAYEEEKYPWLIQEKQYLKEAVLAGKKIVGLCLGCQLLAAALGGEAYRHNLAGSPLISPRREKNGFLLVKMRN